MRLGSSDCPVVRDVVASRPKLRAGCNRGSARAAMPRGGTGGHWFHHTPFTSRSGAERQIQGRAEDHGEHGGDGRAACAWCPAPRGGTVDRFGGGAATVRDKPTAAAVPERA